MKAKFPRLARSAVLVLALALGSCVGQPKEAARAPNIIFILADDMGYADIGAYGQVQVATPNIDRMAAEGIRFTDFYAGAPVCAPSRSVLMTGLHTGHTSVRGNSTNDIQQLRPSETTVAQVLKSAGYATALIGKWGLGDEGTASQPNDKGFDSFFGYLNQSHAHNHYPDFLWSDKTRFPLSNKVTVSGRSQSGFPVGATPLAERREYVEDLFRQRALDYIDANKGRPFFLYLSIVSPHANNEAKSLGTNAMEVPSFGAYADKDWPETAKGYAAMMAHIDETVGQIMQRLKAQGIADNTIVIFASDNGVHAEGGNDPTFLKSSGPLRGIKRDLTEGGIRVPFIVWAPGRAPAGRTSDHVGYFADIMPTAAQLARTRSPATDGLSFASLITGGTAPRHAHLYWEFYEKSGQAVRMGQWKAIRQPMLTGPIELYDLSTDLGEKNNVAAAHPDLVARAKAIMEREHVPDPRWETASSPAG